MSWTGYTYQGSLYPFRRGRYGGRDLSRMLRGVGKMRGTRLKGHKRGCCCCPAVFLLGLAGLGLVAGFFFLGMRFLGWA